MGQTNSPRALRASRVSSSAQARSRMGYSLSRECQALSRCLGIIAALGLALAAGAGCSSGAGRGPIVIGHVGDRGAASPVGRGLALALADLKGDLADALDGRTVQIRHTDPRGLLDAYEAEAARLVAVNRAVALVGGSTPAEVARLDRTQVPVLALLGHAPAGASGFVFTLGMRPEQQGEVLGRHIALERKRATALVLVDELRAEAAPAAEAFVRSFNGARKAEAARVIRLDKDRHWKDVAERVAAVKPHVLAFAGAVSDFRALLAQQKHSASELVYLGGDTNLAALAAGPNDEAIYAATPFNPDDSDSTLISEFVSKYRAANQTVPDVRAALGYDALRLLAEAMRRAAPVLKAERLRDELARVKDLPGVTGPLTITDDHGVRRPLHVVRVMNGVVTALKRYPAATPH